MALTGKNTELAASLLKDGKLVAIPTETVYGLAALATNEKAVLHIFEVKQRPFFDPLILHFHSLDAALAHSLPADERLIKLASHFWPGPLTILLPKKDSIPGIVTSGLAQMAARVPDHPLTLELLKILDQPLAAPSANPFGYISPTEPAHVEKQLGGKVDYILDGGACTVGLESTIVGVEEGKLCIFRLGGLTVEEIEKVAGRVELSLNQSGDPKAPGQLKSHYAPTKPLLLGDIAGLRAQHPKKKLAVICFGDEHQDYGDALVFNLSKKSDLREAAINLFRYLRQADESEAELVLCSLLPEFGLGKAINDRLRRAAAE